MSPRGNGFGRGMGGGGHGQGWGRAHRLRDGSCRGRSVLSPGNVERNAAAIKAASVVALPLLKLAGNVLLGATQRLLRRVRQDLLPERAEYTTATELAEEPKPQQVEVVEVEALPVKDDGEDVRFLDAVPRNSTENSDLKG